MKKMFMYAVAMVMAVCSCQKIDENGGSNNALTPTKSFTFHVKGDFTKSFVEMGTRASVRLEENNTAGVTDLWVLDYLNGVLVQQVHQKNTDEGFGHPQMNLTYGHHDVKFIASKGDTPSLTATALAWVKVKDTFVLDYPIDVAVSSNGNRAPELKRAVSGIKILMTDVVPTNAKQIEITADRSLSLALPSLVASDASESTVTMQFPDSWKGTSNNNAVIYTLCPTDEFTTDVNVKVVATDNSVISDFTISDVSIKKNRITTLTGEVFGRDNGFLVAIDNSWGNELQIAF